MINLIDQYKARTPQKHRENLGQFFTPPAVARFMCQWVLATKPDSIHDPAFGLGAFYFATQNMCPDIPVYATELDERILSFFHSRHPAPRNLDIQCHDYLSAWGKRHAAIVCNPPYMKFQRFFNRKTVFENFQERLGLCLSGYTNTASAFLVKSLAELRANGRLAYLMPAEFLNTGYGEMVKAELLKHDCLKAIIQIAPEKEVFPDAITTVAIILAAKDANNGPISFCTLNRIEELHLDILQQARQVSRNALKPKDKWLRYFEQADIQRDDANLVSLDYYGGFSRGIATGANAFFTFSASRIRHHQIPEHCLRSCITKSAQIKSPIFTDADLAALAEKDAPVFVLDVKGNPPASVRDYIQAGEASGYHQRYLTKCRKPWYKLERRSPAPLLFGVFSRNGFKAVRNLSSAIHLTCYHGFYPNLFGQGFVDLLFLYFRSKAARRILSQSLRRYGDKLDKFEPNDLNSALVPRPDFFKKLSLKHIEQAMKQLKAGKTLPEAIERIFNGLIKGSDNPIMKTRINP